MPILEDFTGVKQDLQAAINNPVVVTPVRRRYDWRYGLVDGSPSAARLSYPAKLPRPPQGWPDRTNAGRGNGAPGREARDGRVAQDPRGGRDVWEGRSIIPTGAQTRPAFVVSMAGAATIRVASAAGATTTATHDARTAANVRADAPPARASSPSVHAAVATTTTAVTTSAAAWATSLGPLSGVSTRRDLFAGNAHARRRVGTTRTTATTTHQKPSAGSLRRRCSATRQQRTLSRTDLTGSTSSPGPNAAWTGTSQGMAPGPGRCRSSVSSTCCEPACTNPCR
jgi:hypothetical protein